MSFEGTFDQVPASEVFRILGATGRTGLLHVERGATRKQIILDAGRWVFCTAGTLKETLGRHLVAHAIVSESEVAEAVIMQRAGGYRLGAALIAMGRVDEATLRAVLTTKIRDSLHDIVTWRQGSFKFVEGRPLGDRVPFRISAGWEEIVDEGTKRTAALERVRRFLPDPTARLYVDTERLSARPTASRLDEAVLQAMIQGETPAQACSRLAFTDSEILCRIAELVERRVLCVNVPDEPARLRAAAAVVEDAPRLIAAGHCSHALAALQQACSADVSNRHFAAARFAVEAGIRDRLECSLGDPARAMLRSAGEERVVGAAFTAGELFVASCLDGEMPVDAILRSCPSGHLDGMAAIDGLFRRGLLRVAVKPQAERPAASEDLVLVGVAAPVPGRARRPSVVPAARRRVARRHELEPGPGSR